MKLFNLSVITPYGEIFNDDVQALVAPGSQGSLGVLAGHRPMIVQLKDGVVEIGDKHGKRLFYASASGILEVIENNKVLLLIDNAVKIDSKDIDQKYLNELIRI